MDCLKQENELKNFKTEMNHIVKYNIPDSTWSAFTDAKTYEEYQKNYVIKGKFHKHVPEDIVNDYEIVEHIMAQSYFYYPMYSEALRKLLTTYEMALKLKYKQIKGYDWKGEKITLEDDKIRKGNNLDTLIRWLHQNGHLERNLDFYLHMKEIRNINMHPRQYSFMGASASSIIRPLVNIFSEIFVPSEIVQDRQTKLNHYKEEFISLGAGPFVLNYNSSRFLIFQVEPLSYLNEKLFTVFWPIFDRIPESSESSEMPDPILLSLSDLSCSKHEIQAKDFFSGQEINITTTNHPENLRRTKDHLFFITSKEASNYRALCGYAINRFKEEQLYENYWLEEI
ncbi:MAG: hypothetical protein ACEPOZ_19990 [Marinifilaceae bacterium]